MAITFNPLKNASKIYRATDGGVTFSASLHASAAFDYFLNSPSVDDAIYFCYDFWNPWTGSGRWQNIVVNVGTARTSAGAGVWEYHIGAQTGGSWSTLTCTDPTNGLTTTGSNTITFDIPDDWSVFRPGTTGEWYANRYFIRYRLTNVTGITEGGANAADLVQMNDWSIHVVGLNGSSAYAFDDIYDAEVAGSWGVVTETSNAYTYTINASLIIGDGSTETNFADTYTTAIIGGILYVYGSKTTFKLGSTDTNGDPRYGCQLIMKEPNSNTRSYSIDWGVSGGVSGCNLAVYDTLVRFANYIQLGNTTGSYFIFKGNKFCDAICMHSNATLDRCDYTNCGDGLRMSSNMGSVNDCKIMSTNFGALFGWIYTVVNIRCTNLTIGSDVDTHIYFAGTIVSGCIFNAVDWAGLDLSKITKASGDFTANQLNIIYSINPKVINHVGSPITGARVSVTNGSGQIFSGTTTITGIANVETVAHNYYLTSSLTANDYSNCVLKIEASGCETYQTPFTLNGKETMNIKLRQSLSQGRDEMGDEFR